MTPTLPLPASAFGALRAGGDLFPGAPRALAHAGVVLAALVLLPVAFAAAAADPPSPDFDRLMAQLAAAERGNRDDAVGELWRWLRADSRNILPPARAERAGPLLVRMLTDDAPGGSRRLAIDVLGQIREPRAVEPLLGLLNLDSPVPEEEEVVRALGRISDLRAVEPLLALCRGPVPPRAPRRKQVAAVSLGEISRAVGPLVGALRDEVPGVRRCAAEALGMIGDKAAVEPLLAALRDGDADVQEAVVVALGSLADPRAAEPLIEMRLFALPSG